MTLFDANRRLEQGRTRFKRRAILLAAVAGVAGYSLRRWWKTRPRPVANRPVSFVTQSRDFYQVSIKPGFRAPVTDEMLWSVETRSPDVAKSWSLSQIRALPSRRIFRTLSCVSNPVGGTAIGNAQWTVTDLQHVLDPLIGSYTAQLREGRDAHVVFRGADGFHSAVPLSDAMAPETFLAYEMNGQPLPEAHGHPLRVLLPDRYGMKQPRWLESIEIQSGGHWGYWERRGWSNTGRVQSMSRIDRIQRERASLLIVSGVAWCGGRLVGGVELSADGGLTWAKADLDSPVRSGAWVTWIWNWENPPTEETVLTVRVRDSGGHLQEDSYSGTFPSGATGLHRVTVCE